MRSASKPAGVWSNPDFRKLWFGQTVSEIGSRITRDGLPLAAVILLGATPTQMGILTGLSGVSVLLFSMYAGVWADRVRRKPVMILSDLGRAALLAAVPIAAVTGNLRMSLLYAVAALSGVLSVLFVVAYQAYVPALVSKQQVLEANSKLSVSNAAAEIIGPGLTGILVQTLTAPIAILADALSFLASAASLVWITKPESAPDPPADAPNAWREMKEGIHAIRDNPILVRLAARSVVANFCYGMLATLYTLYAIRDLEMTPLLFGLTVATGGIGNLFGALLSNRLRLGSVFLQSALIHSLAIALIPLAGGSHLRILACMMGSQLIGDAAWVVYAVHETSVRQAIVPDRLMGRVNGAMQLLSRGVFPLGSVVGGALATVHGARWVLWAAAAGALASTVLLVGMRGRHAAE
ncbi:MAG: MFS transporter [Bryobacteraceae bacterium]